jgi:hypothetical protein
MAKFKVAGDQYFGITGQILEIQRQIRQLGGSPIDPNLVSLSLQDIIEGRFNGEIIKNFHADLLTKKNEDIVIDPCKGNKTFLKARDFVLEGEDEKLKKYFPDTKSDPTPKTSVDIYQMTGTVSVQSFLSFGLCLYDLCFSQSQILSFYRKYGQKRIERSQMAHFLYQASKEIFVAGLHPPLSKGDEPCIHIKEFTGTDWLCTQWHQGVMIIPKFRKFRT